MHSVATEGGLGSARMCAVSKVDLRRPPVRRLSLEAITVGRKSALRVQGGSLATSTVGQFWVRLRLAASLPCLLGQLSSTRARWVW
jgi:hypothetical protein